MPLDPQGVRFLVVHCSASPPNARVNASVIDRWHRERGFRKIGYHYVINRDGGVEVGRARDEVGAHAEGFNNSSLGICLVGGVDTKGAPENNFTKPQFASLTRLLTALRKDYPAAEVLGHRDLPNVKKACPSFDVSEWLASL
jgi:N-acetylmuramoyl-L-alanine amidase